MPNDSILLALLYERKFPVLDFFKLTRAFFHLALHYCVSALTWNGALLTIRYAPLYNIFALARLSSFLCSKAWVGETMARRFKIIVLLLHNDKRISKSTFCIRCVHYKICFNQSLKLVPVGVSCPVLDTYRRSYGSCFSFLALRCHSALRTVHW